ncbi:MAG: hypothetical protein NC182_07945, partial [Prevotella sp.]|nr:hypothetical protein [Staphylococcus sp.]MCM1351106.1 hypothetical protein [Prevotella sp.]
ISLISIGFSSWYISEDSSNPFIEGSFETDKVIYSDNLVKVNYDLGDIDSNGKKLGYSRLVFNNTGFVGTFGNQMTIFYKIDMNEFCEEFGIKNSEGVNSCSVVITKFSLFCNEEALSSLKPDDIKIKFSTNSNMNNTYQMFATISDDKMNAEVSVKSSVFGKNEFTGSDEYIYVSITYIFASVALTNSQVSALQKVPFSIVVNVSGK